MKLRRSSKWIQASLVAVLAVFSASALNAQEAGGRIAVVNSEKVFNKVELNNKYNKLTSNFDCN